MYRIPFNRPAAMGHEQIYIAQAISSGHISGDGPFTQKCHGFLQEALGVPKALLTTSCTHALEMTALLLDIRSGDEVIVPDFTFVSSINAFVLRGAKPVFADVRPDTFNLDETRLASLITPRTKAIVPVHYAGVGCEMGLIMEVARGLGIAVVEDNAHGLFGKVDGKWLGTFGPLATLSFHETKNFQCGEGGALLINDPAYIERAEIIREKGTNRSLFFRGQIDKYTWVSIGSSYLPSDLLAAYLFAQFEARGRILSVRRRLWKNYRSELTAWAGARDVRLPTIPDHCDHPHHLFYLLMPSLESRTALIDHLKARGIIAVFHYLPLHLSKMGLQFGGRVGDCPVAEDISDRLIRLPLYNSMTEAEQAEVIETIKEFPS